MQDRTGPSAEAWRLLNNDDGLRAEVALRWAAASTEMESASRISAEEKATAIEFWRKEVKKQIAEHPLIQLADDEPTDETMLELRLLNPKT